MFVYHFFDLEIGDLDTTALLYWGLKKILCRACLFFLFIFLVFGDKNKIALKALLVYTFIPWLWNYFDLLSDSSE